MVYFSQKDLEYTWKVLVQITDCAVKIELYNKELSFLFHPQETLDNMHDCCFIRSINTQKT